MDVKTYGNLTTKSGHPPQHFRNKILETNLKQINKQKEDKLSAMFSPSKQEKTQKQY